MKIFETPTASLFKKALDVYTRQHEGIAKNVAFANDPDYKKVKTDFSAELQKLTDRRLKVSDERHLGNPETPTPLRPDSVDENLDIAEEMSKLAENQVRFDFTARALRRKFDGLDTAINGRAK